MSRQIATFVLGDTLFGIDILLAKEVYRHMTLNPIPNAPPHLKGLMNLRGRIVTVIDLNVCLNRPQMDTIENKRLLILKTANDIKNYKHRSDLEDVEIGEDIVGFLIDRMDDVVSVSSIDISPPPSNLQGLEQELIDGVIQQGERLMMLLNVTAILDRVMSAVSESET